MALKEELEEQGNFLFKYRTYLPLILLGAGILVFIFSKINGHCFNNPVGYWILDFSVGLIGLFVRIYTVGHTPVNTSGRNTTEGQIADQLNVTGAYSLVRHPLYLGNFLMWLSIALLTANSTFILLFILSFWIYYERIMYAEESFLRKGFGPVFENWAATVPAFIPKSTGFVAPKYPFSWKKVLKKEKNGLAALVGLFFVFEYIDRVIITQNWSFYLSPLSVGFCTVLILYTVLKILKKNSSILEEEGR